MMNPERSGFDELERQGHDFAETERTLKAEIEDGYNPDPGVTIEKVGLEGSYPDTVLYLIFRSAKRPGHRFRYDYPLWVDHPSDAATAVIMSNFEEAVIFELDKFEPL
jgi:hypothetical protein